MLIITEQEVPHPLNRFFRKLQQTKELIREILYEELSVKTDQIRPLVWIMLTNPSLRAQRGAGIHQYTPKTPDFRLSRLKMRRNRV